MSAVLAAFLLLLPQPTAALARQVGEASAAQSAPLLEIPDPNLEGVDPAVARQMQSQLEQTREAARSGDLEPPQLAGSFGGLGELFLLYEMFIQAEVAFVNATSLDPGNHRWHYFLGVLTQELRRLEEAAGHFRKVLAMDPEYLSALIRLGNIERLANRPEEARIWYQRALDLFPRSPATHWGLGQMAYGSGDSQTAVEHFEAVLETQPEASAVHYPLALAYRDLGELDKARQHLEQRGERKVMALDPLVDGLPQRLEGYSLYLLRGNQNFSRGNFEVAASAYAKAVEADPDSVLARHAYASALTEVDRFKEALEQLEWIIEHSPEDGVAHYNLGTLHFQLGDADRALSHLQRAVEYSPDLANARFNLGFLLEQRGRLDEALEQYIEARRLNPQDSGVIIRYAVLRAQSGHADEARSELEAVLTVDPDNFEARLALGGVLAAGSRREDALAEYRHVIEASEDTQERARAHFESGQLLLAAGQTSSAIEQLESALELMPRIAEARNTLANALARDGRLAEAAEQFATVTEQNPDFLGAHVGRAMALLLDRRDAQAVVSLEQGLAALPQQSELSHLLSRVLATSAEVGVRDGARALRLSEQVLMRQRTPRNAETVAMALAELGHFEDAVRLQSRILQEATQYGSAELAKIENRLRRYERGEPVRSPWLADG